MFHLYFYLTTLITYKLNAIQKKKKKWLLWEQGWVVQFLVQEEVLTQWVVGLNIRLQAQIHTINH